MDNIQNLLTQVYSISEKYEKLAQASGENFNIFKILGLHSNEVKLHSNLLSELLNPKGSHGKGETFLKLFCDLQKIENFIIYDAKVEVEISTGSISENREEGGRIDILITDTKKKYIIIENKIYARDQENQLVRYKNFDKENTAKLFYLTLFGDEPSDNSKGNLKSNEDYFCISYKADIITWLEACQKEAVNHAMLRETILQYIHIIKYLTNQSINQVMANEIVKKVLSSNENFLGYLEIKKSDEDILNGILEKLKTKLSKLAESLNLKSSFDVNRNKIWTGFSFWNDNLTNVNLIIRFEFDKKYTQNLYFGFRYNIETSNTNSNLAQILENFKKEFGNYDDSKLWPCYIEFKEFYDWNYETYYQIFQTDDFVKAVEAKLKIMLDLISLPKTI